MPITLDASERPIFQIRYQGILTDDEVKAHDAELESALAEWGAPFYLCVDVKVTNVPAGPRELILAWARRFEAERVGRNAGVVFVTDSRIARGIIRSLHWMARPRYEWEIAKDLASGMAWCRARVG